MNKLPLFSIGILVLLGTLSCATPEGGARDGDGLESSVSSAPVTTSESTPESAKPDALPDIKADAAAADIKINECPPKEVTCPEIFSPTYCSARSYKDAALPDEEVVRAWGENSCAAKLALAAETCRSGKSPSALGGVECVPDVSQGKCPAKRKICTMDVNPVVCTAVKYGTQPLAGRELISSQGSNECDGRNNLMQQACIQNLNPEKLGGIKCKAPK